MQGSQSARFVVWTPISLLLLIAFATKIAAGVSIPSEYETVQNPNNVVGAASTQYLSSNPRTTTGGVANYYSEPKNAQYYYPADAYTYGYGNNVLAKQDFGAGGDDDGGDAGTGLIGLVGLLGLAGLIPALLPLVGPLLGLLFIALLPILLPLIGPLLPILLLPLLVLALPLILLFLPVPVITVPVAGGRSTTNDVDIARMIYNAISQDECIERYTCEVTQVARNFGVNTQVFDRIFGFFLGKKQASSKPKWMESIERASRNTESCKKYSCSGKLL